MFAFMFHIISPFVMLIDQCPRVSLSPLLRHSTAICILAQEVYIGHCQKGGAEEEVTNAT
jgi:hypothetical protein